MTTTFTVDCTTAHAREIYRVLGRKMPQVTESRCRLRMSDNEFHRALLLLRLENNKEARAELESLYHGEQLIDAVLGESKRDPYRRRYA